MINHRKKCFAILSYYNYPADETELFSNLYLAKFLNILAKLFFSVDISICLTEKQSNYFVVYDSFRIGVSN